MKLAHPFGKATVTASVVGQREAVTEGRPVIRRSNLVRVLPGEAPEDNIKDRDEGVATIPPWPSVAKTVTYRKANVPGWKVRHGWPPWHCLIGLAAARLHFTVHGRHSG